MNDELEIAIRAAIAAGYKILSIYEDPDSDFEIEKKADHSPLTIADKNANLVIESFLKQTEYPILSEEGKLTPYDERKHWDTLWIVDPLDGTKEFIKRNGEFTVNIALVRQGIPIVGVIYLPVKNVLYFASESAGAYMVTGIARDDVHSTDEWIKMGLKLPLEKGNRPYTIVASRSHLSAETALFIDEKRAQHRDLELTSVGSSIKICLIAEGKADIYPRFAPTMEWDTAAGDAIARAAGFQLRQSDNNMPLRYNKENLLNPWFIAE